MCPAFPLTDASLTAATEGLVTAWSRPYRHPNYTGTLDAIYLAMENGGIYYLEVDGSVNALVQNVVKASYLDCAIGTAFTALDYGLRSNDMIVAGGEMSSGGIYLVSSTRCERYPLEAKTHPPVADRSVASRLTSGAGGDGDQLGASARFRAR